MLMTFYRQMFFTAIGCYLSNVCRHEETIDDPAYCHFNIHRELHSIHIPASQCAILFLKTLQRLASLWYQVVMNVSEPYINSNGNQLPRTLHCFSWIFDCLALSDMLTGAIRKTWFCLCSLIRHRSRNLIVKLVSYYKVWQAKDLHQLLFLPTVFYWWYFACA